MVAKNQVGGVNDAKRAKELAKLEADPRYRLELRIATALESGAPPKDAAEQTLATLEAHLARRAERPTSGDGAHPRSLFQQVPAGESCTGCGARHPESHSLRCPQQTKRTG